MRAAIALCVLVASAAVPMAKLLVADDHACCCADDERDTEPDSGRDDRDAPGAPSECEDRGCCVVGCRVVTADVAPSVAVASVVRVVDVLARPAKVTDPPSSGVYRPPRA
ncbi:MAG: hypothetical protein IT379_03360 [Deltaproteobacteria bacterium]|nr:hypothetical protein [Deltaproteobacteria bacterium]